MRYVLVLMLVASLLAMVATIEILPAWREGVRRWFNPNYRQPHGPEHALYRDPSLSDSVKP